MSCVASSSLLLLGHAKQAEHTLKLLEVEYQELENAPSYLQGLLFAHQAALLYEQNQLEQAFDLAQQALHLIEQTDIVLFMEQSYVILIQIFLSRQQHAAAQEMLQRFSTLLAYRDNEYAQASLLSGLQVRFWLATGKLQLAVQWRKQWQKLAPLQPVFAQERVAIAQARVLLTEQKSAEAHHLLTTWLPQARLAERKAHVLEMCLLEALACQQMQRGPEALQALAEALVIGESEGFVRHFLDEGAQLVPLLQRSRACHGGGYIDRLLEAFEQEKQKMGKVAIRASFTLNQALIIKHSSNH